MFHLLRPTQVKSEKSDSETPTSTSALQRILGRESKSTPGHNHTDINDNGIIDSHEKWFLFAKILVLVWSLGFLTSSYLGNDKIDRTFVGATFTASIASFGMKRLPK